VKGGRRAVTFELTGVARLRAGTSRLEVEACSLGQALARLAAARPGIVPDVVSVEGALTRHFMASQNGGGFTRDAGLALAPGDTVVIVGAQAGG
jgi:hypothetical protein